MPRNRSFFEQYALVALIVSIIVVIGISGYVFAKNFMAQKERHQQIIMHLNALQLVDMQIDSYFSYEYQNINYDESIKSIGRFRSELAVLRKLTGRFDSTEEMQAVNAQFDRIDTLSKKREIYLEKHESYKAVAINSMRYLPGLYGELKQYLLHLPFKESFKNRVSGEAADVLTYIFYSLFKDAESTSRLDENIAGIKTLCGRDAKLDKYLDFFVLHSKNIERQKLHIDQNIAKKNILNLKEEVKKLSLLYLEYLDKNYEDKKQLNILLFAVGIVLLIILLIVLYKEQKFKYQLENLNDTLEIRIKEETQKRIENEQILMQQSKLNAMGELITSISHQWRQPLNALGIIVQDIEDAYDYNELNKEYIENTIARSMGHIESMSKTIDEFRSFFKRSDTEVEIDVIKCFQYAIQMLSYRIEEYGIVLNIRHDENDVYTVMGLRSEFEQVLMILVNNAIDAIKKEQVRATEQKEGRIDVSVSKHEGMIRIEIEDNGIGIDAAIAGRIFEPYYTTKDQGEGVGMGLYVAKVILENHMNGRIRYVPESEKTKFIITLESV